MRRNELQLLNDAHIALTEWAEWEMTREDRSSIGHARRTVEGRMQKEAVGVQQSGYFQGRCPEVMRPPRIKRVNQAVKELPHLPRMAVWCKYWPERAEETDPGRKAHVGRWTEAQKLNLFRELTGRGRHDYYSLWDIGRAFVAARL